MPEIDLATIVRGHRVALETEWVLPPWENELGHAILPLFAKKDGRYYPKGTAFSVSKFGIVATATHCILDSMKDELPSQMDSDGHHEISRTELAVLRYDKQKQGIRFSLWPLTSVAGSGDVAYCSLLPHHPPLQLLSTVLSPGIPRPSTTVLTIGYRFRKYPSDGIAEGSTFGPDEYFHELVAVEGVVDSVFLHRHRYLKGPCFTTSNRTHHGQSGGPVVNETGHICGVHSGVLVEGQGLASMIYPSIATKLKTPLIYGASHKISVTTPIGLLMLNGVIKTDGSERLVRAEKDERGIRIDPLVKRDDEIVLFDDPSSKERNKRSQRHPLP